MSEALITKYRPQSFDDLLLFGHAEALGALQRRLSSDTCPHAFLFTGPSGIGKTTISRIVARELRAEVLEVDAASNSSVDAARQLVEIAQYRPLGGAERKMVLVDEAHGLSRQAMDALLKTLEEPPPHLYFALCTTEEHRIRDTIVTRCYAVRLRPLLDRQIEELLATVCELEEWRPIGDVLQMVTQAATGQPRKALSLLQEVHDVKSRDEAKRIISLVEESDPVSILLRDLAQGKFAWKLIQPTLAKLIEDEGFDFDSLAAQAGRYIANAMVREGDEKRARALWHVLAALTFPASTYDRRAAFMAAMGRVLWDQ